MGIIVGREGMVRRVGWLAVIACQAACTPFTTMTTARTLGKGNFELLAGATYLHTHSEVSPEIDEPQVTLGLTYGVADNVDLALRLSTFAVNAQGKVQLYRSKSPDSGFDLAVAPSVGYSFAFGMQEGGCHVPTASLAILGGINLPGGHQVVLAPKLMYEAFTWPHGAAHTVYAGGSLGVALRLGSRVTLFPEVAVLTPIGGPWGDEPPDFDPINLRVQAAIGVLIGL